MKAAYLKDEAFLADAAAHRGQPGLRLWWLGQSGFLVHFDGFFALFDPYLSDSLTRKYAATDKPHVRITERVVDPARLENISLVTSSHNHTDHLDAETLNPLRAANPGLRIIVPEANRAFAAGRLGCDPDELTGLVDGQRVEHGPFMIEALPAAHEALETDDRGRNIYLGYVLTAGPYRVYHSGDTVLYDGLAGRLRAFDLDAALLPINGSLPERRVAGNLWGREAAALAHEAGIRLAIPCHFDMFEFNTVAPDEFLDACEELGQDCRLLANGEGVTL
ncbi:MAG: MBL fold metallo-hydrolase [Bryobacteraceae bacterium]|nr:MBL fold metallo-hydrolase [Bryobacteraceae bacterium]